MLNMMRHILLLSAVLIVTGSCALEDPVVPSVDNMPVEFISSRMRIITKAGDEAQRFPDGTRFKLFAVQSSSGPHDWSNTVLYDREGTESSGTVNYGEKVSYGVAPLNVLDFYGVTYGSGSSVPSVASDGGVPKVSVSMTSGSLPDLMYSDNLKSKTSSSGLLNLEFRHAMSRLNIEILKQDESHDAIKQLEGTVVEKIILKGTGTSGNFNVETGLWESVSSEAVTVYEGNMPVTTDVQKIVSGLHVIPIDDGKVVLDIYLSGIEDAVNPVSYTLTVDTESIGESRYLYLKQNHEYTFSIVILKNDVRVVTVTPKVYDWIDVDLSMDDLYLGQPVFFGGLMWMDRNLGAKSADCENDWYNTIGSYYQHGRNIPFMLDVDVWKTKFNKSSKVSFSGNAFAEGLIYSLNDKNQKIYEYIPATGASAPESDLPYYDQVAKNPGDAGVDYRFICGFNSWSSWARGSNNLQDPRNDTYWDDVENHPCPKGWRLPTRKDMYKYLPEHYNNIAKWQNSYTHGRSITQDYVAGNSNSLGEVYGWKYFSAMFKVDPSAEGDWSYPVSDGLSHVYLIKYEGTPKAYRILIEQRKADTGASDGSVVKKYVRISRFETTADDRFLISSDGTQWNLHEFDWKNPAEYMDFPLCGYIDSGDNTNTIVKHHPYLGAFGNGCILRSQEIDPSVAGRNWTMYFMDTFKGVTVGGASRRSLGDQIRCVRDINAK